MKKLPPRPKRQENQINRLRPTARLPAEGPAVAKEDVDVENPSKRARTARPSTKKPQKKAGSRLMDYTG